jgi:FkbM family methyltransferase
MNDFKQIRTLQVNIAGSGTSLPFSYFGNSHDHIVRILNGITYPTMPDIGMVQTIVDIGANVGAATVMLAASYPLASVHAFEPGPTPRSLLTGNVAPLGRVTVHPFGLGGKDEECKLYRSRWDPMSASVLPSAENTTDYDVIQIRRATDALNEAGVTTIDVLKIDTEGCEVPVLLDIAELVRKTRVIYLEYHCDADRRRIDAMLEPSHVLSHASAQHPHRGDVSYVHRESQYANVMAATAITR